MKNTGLPNDIIEASEYIQERIQGKPQVALVLGSGLGSFVDSIEDQVIVPYQDIPHFVATSIEGHKGQIVAGRIDKVNIIALQGRFHYYEGYHMSQVVLPVRVTAALGAHTCLITNAAGGVNLDFKPGDLMIIEDHINLMGMNPLMGKESALFGPRFPDMSETYCRKSIQLLKEIAASENIDIQQGVYAANIGPTYETPAEVRMLRTLGADAVGMSTVPESIAAHHLGMRVVGVSCITNMAAGIDNEKLSHDDVKATAGRVVNDFSLLLEEFIKRFESDIQSD